MGINRHDLENPQRSFHKVEEGIPHRDLTRIIELFSSTDLIATALQVSSNELSRMLASEDDTKLSCQQSDVVVDLMRTAFELEDTFGEDLDAWDEWLQSPIPAVGHKVPLVLMQTFEGRRLVRSTLKKIQYGDMCT